MQAVLEDSDGRRPPSAKKLKVLTSKSLFIFAYRNPVRIFCRNLVESAYFDFAIFSLILVNCILVMCTVPLPNNDECDYNETVDTIDTVFLAFYILEMLLKMIAWGVYFCGETSYLRGGWNRFDFAIIVVGITSLAFAGATTVETGPLRSARALKMLRLLNSSAQLQVVMAAIYHSIPRLLHVAALVFFLITIFSIVGLEFYRELDDTNSPWPGVVNFDNAGNAMLTIFTCMTLEGWTSIMYWVNNETDRHWANYIFFITVVLLGAYIALDLAMGVLSGHFTVQSNKQREASLKIHRMTTKRQAQERANYRDWMDAANFLRLAAKTGPGSLALGPHQLKIFPRHQFSVVEFGFKLHTELEAIRVMELQKRISNNSVSDDGTGISSNRLGDQIPVILVRDFDGAIHVIDLNDPDMSILNLRNYLFQDFPNVAIPNDPRADEDDIDNVKGVAQFGQVQETPFFRILGPVGQVCSEPTFVTDIVQTRSENEVIELQDPLRPAVVANPLLKHSMLTIVTPAGAIAKSKEFTLAISVVVMCDMCFTASNHFPANDTAHQVFTISEAVFLTIYCLEFIFKVLALRPRAYFTSKFNRLDFIVVVTGIINLLFQVLLQLFNTPWMLGLSVLRAFRLLKLFKYTGYWDTVRDFSVSLIQASGSVVALLVLIFITLSLFGLVGMSFFGGKFTYESHHPRTNFDDFGQAFLAIFQVITLEDWNIVMYYGIEALGGYPGDDYVGGTFATIFFVGVVIIGAYVLINVFLAIAVQALDASRNGAELRAQHDEKWSSDPTAIEHVDCFVAHEWGIDEEGRDMEKRVTSICKILKRMGYTTTNSDTLREASGYSVSQLRDRTHAMIDASQIFVCCVSRAYIAKLNMSHGSQSQEQFLYAKTKIKSNRIIYLAMEASLLSPTRWGKVLAGTDAIDDFVHDLTIIDFHDDGDDGLSVDSFCMSELGHEIDDRVVTSLFADPAVARKQAKALALSYSSLFCLPRSKEWRQAQIEAGILPEESTTLSETAEPDHTDGHNKLVKDRGQSGSTGKEDDHDGHHINEMSESDEKEVVHLGNEQASAAFVLRERVYDIIVHPYFERFILLLIVASSVCLAFEDPVDDDAQINKDLSKAEYVFTALFTMELLLKITALGFISHPTAYLRDSWNQLDAFCVVTAWIAIAVSGLAAVRVLRTLRVLRALRAIKRLPGLQVLVSSLVSSVRAIFNVMMITLLLVFVFACIGIILFKGTFASCNDMLVRQREACTGTFISFPDNDFTASPVLTDREWHNPFYNFDNIGTAVLTLIATATTEGWVGFLVQSTDGVYQDRGQGPVSYKPITCA